jgi:CspA family cold shock protein
MSEGGKEAVRELERLLGRKTMEVEILKEALDLELLDGNDRSGFWTSTGQGSGRISGRSTVKFFNGERGYGFIQPNDGCRDVFVHITAVERAGLKSLIEGQRISYDVEPDKKGKGPKAVNLVV